jgi:hypothetical protein
MSKVALNQAGEHNTSCAPLGFLQTAYANADGFLSVAATSVTLKPTTVDTGVCPSTQFVGYINPLSGE